MMPTTSWSVWRSCLLPGTTGTSHTLLAWLSVRENWNMRTFIIRSKYLYPQTTWNSARIFSPSLSPSLPPSPSSSPLPLSPFPPPSLPLFLSPSLPPPLPPLPPPSPSLPPHRQPYYAGWARLWRWHLEWHLTRVILYSSSLSRTHGTSDIQDIQMLTQPWRKMNSTPM